MSLSRSDAKTDENGRTLSLGTDFFLTNTSFFIERALLFLAKYFLLFKLCIPFPLLQKPHHHQTFQVPKNGGFPELKPSFSAIFLGGIFGNSLTSAVSIQHQAAWKSWCRQAVARSTMNPWCNTSRWMRRSPLRQNHEVTSEDQGYLDFEKCWENHVLLEATIFCGCFCFFVNFEGKAKKSEENTGGLSWDFIPPPIKKTVQMLGYCM